MNPTEIDSSAEAGAATARLLNDWQDISLLKIALIVLGAWAIVTVVRVVVPFLAERGPSQVRLYLLASVPIVRFVVLIGAIVWIVPIVFNVTFQNFLVIAGAASVAVGFAFKDYVSSLIAGIVVIFERPYRPGDWVEIDGDYGEVRNLGMRALQLRTANDNIVTVPHDRVWNDNISNSNDGGRTLMCVASFHVAPDHDAKRLRERLRDVAVTSAYLEYGRPVAVQLVQKPWGTRYQVKAYPFDMRDQFTFVSDLTVRGKLAIAQSGAREVAVGALGEGEGADG